MAVISELTLHTGTMTFESLMEVDTFLKTMPSAKRGLDALQIASANGLCTVVDQQLLTPSTFYTKRSYVDQATYNSVMTEVDEPSLQAAVSALGWTFDRVLSYTYS